MVFRFNSKVVRLQESPRTSVPIRKVFQFQSGTIASGVTSTVMMLPEECFNSKVVRLQVRWSRLFDSVRRQFQFQSGTIAST